MTLLSLMSFHPLAHTDYMPFDPACTVGDVITLCLDGQVHRIRSLRRRHIPEIEAFLVMGGFGTAASPLRHGLDVHACERGRAGQWP